MYDDTIFVTCKDKITGHLHIYYFKEHLYKKVISVIKRDAISASNPLKTHQAIDLIENVLYMIQG